MSVDTTLPRSASTLFRFLSLFVLLALPSAVHSQHLDERTAGQTYVLAFPDTVTNGRDNRFQDPLDEHLYVFIYSAVDTKVAITGTGYNRTVNCATGKFQVVDLLDPAQSATQPIVTDVGHPSGAVFRLEARDPIVVYSLMVTRFGSEAFTPIPVEFWGNQYYAAGIPGEVGRDISPAGPSSYNATAKMFPCEITIVAADSNTVVSITPAGRLMDTTWKTTVTLQANQVYQLQSYVDTAHPDALQPEFAGTFIQSNKPIGVISGNTRAQAEDIQPGLGKNIYKNMMMEWLAPVDQHGYSFVYMPTMDGNQLTGVPNEKPEEKRPEEWVRIYGTNGQNRQTTGSYTIPYVGSLTNFTIKAPGAKGYLEQRIQVPEGVYFKTDLPAQAFMNTVAAVKFLGTTGSGGNIGAKYDGVGTFMTEMTARELWVKFAPFYAPVAPSGMTHIVSVVADTNSAKRIVFGTKLGQPTGLFNFTRRIKGTDLIWGYQTVTPGLDYYITGWDFARNVPDTNVRFGGDVRGVRVGHEEWQPGATRRKDEGDPSIASGGRGGDQTLQMSVGYEERLSVAYAYPLAPARILLHYGDSLQIDTVRDCTTLHVQLKAVNANPVGLKSTGLQNSRNAKLVFIDPTNPKDLIAKTTARFDVSPIDPLQDASAMVVIKDRTNKTWQFFYSYQAERVDLAPSGKNGDDLDFGYLPLDSSSVTQLTITNPLVRDINIKELKFVQGGEGFRILSPTFPPAVILKPGDSIHVQVEITPTVPNRYYQDTLRIIMECTELRIKVEGETIAPRLSANDLDFGIVAQGSSTNGFLNICNEGGGFISFSNPNGDSVITGFGPYFSVNNSEIQKLKTARLGYGDCIRLGVTFGGSQPGAYQTTLHIWSTISSGGDSVLLRGIIQESVAGVTAPGMAGYGLGQNDPNPFHDATSIEFSIPSAGKVRLEIYDLLGRRVATLVDGTMQRGVHSATWNASGLPPGIYYCRMLAGEWNSSRKMILR
jgi:hypothetical protein